MCRAAKKLWGNYRQNQTTQEFLEALAPVIGIPITELIQTVRGGNPSLQGTWVHSRVAIHLAMWCSSEFAVQVTGWVEEWYLSRRSPQGPHELSYFQGMLGLIRDVKDLLQDLEMYEDQDRLLLADHVRNVLLAASGRLALPAARGEEAELTDRARLWSVGDRILECGYPQRWVGTGDKRIHRYLIQIGKLAAAAYRGRHGHSPTQATRYVDGATRKIYVYPPADLDLLDVAIEQVLGAPPPATVE